MGSAIKTISSIGDEGSIGVLFCGFGTSVGICI